MGRIPNYSPGLDFGPGCPAHPGPLPDCPLHCGLCERLPWALTYPSPDPLLALAPPPPLSNFPFSGGTSKEVPTGLGCLLFDAGLMLSMI